MIQKIFNTSVTHRYHLLYSGTIGKGGFGEVFHAKLHGADVAVKKFFAQEMSSQDMDLFRSELTVMSKLRSPNIILLIGACSAPGNLLIVMELAKSSLDKYLTEQNKKFSMKDRLMFAKDAVLGMNWLHHGVKPAILHLDLKAANLLIDQSNTVKVSDFGFATSKVNGESGRLGTPQWMSPEMLLEKPFDTKTDVYSFGICSF